jgi:hypothetical protein
MKSDLRKRSISVALVVTVILALVVPVAVGAQEVTPIPGPETVLPDYIGAPAKAHPTANSGVPQNPLLAPDPFSHAHFDPWMSDTANIAGPLGRDPEVLSSRLDQARDSDSHEWIFNCIPIVFDSHGRPISVCINPKEATVVLLDPDTLEVLSHHPLDIPPGDPYKGDGRQRFLASMGTIYSFLDAHDRFTVVSGGNQIITLVEGGSEESPVLELLEGNTYDLKEILPETNPIVSGAILDWQGRIWFATPDPATIWVLNPATFQKENPDSVKRVLLDPDEAIRNTFALTKIKGGRTAAYVVTSKQMYRVDAGPDDQPYKVWSEPYKRNENEEVRLGQYEVGSGTSPTILGEGKYVAITDDNTQLQVVVFRTDERLDPNEERIVCEVPVFDFQGGGNGALSNSLIGSRLSLIASNNYNYWFDWENGKLQSPSAPGFERIDIEPNGKSCRKIWTNTEVATTVSPRLSTKTGLIYTIARKLDEGTLIDEKPLDVYYWTAIDFRTGETVWQKRAGTGSEFDSFYPALGIGPNGALYSGGYGRFMSVRDTR